MYKVGKQGSGSPKLRCGVSCQRLHGTEAVITASQIIPSRHQVASHRMYAFHSRGSLWMVTVSVPQFLCE
jgi:hypothetical protein